MRCSVSIKASVLLLALAPSALLTAQELDRENIVLAIDSIVNEPIEAGQIAGASVAVVQGPDTILLKAYGFADLEYHVPTPDRAIYEIGSVTKQFTAVAILQLVAAGTGDMDVLKGTYRGLGRGREFVVTIDSDSTSSRPDEWVVCVEAGRPLRSGLSEPAQFILGAFSL